MLFGYHYQKEYLKKKTEFHKDQKYFLQCYFIAVIYNISVSLLTLTITSNLQIFKAKRIRLFPRFTLLIIIICIACFWKMLSLKTNKVFYFEELVSFCFGILFYKKQKNDQKVHKKFPLVVFLKTNELTTVHCFFRHLDRI